VRIDVTALQHDAILLEPTPQMSFRALKTSEEPAGTADFVWIGELADIPGQAVLVVRGEKVTGNIHAGSDLYQVRPLDDSGLHAVIKVNQAEFPEEHPPEFEAIERQSGTYDLEALPDEAAELPGQIREISLLVAYTPAVKAKIADVDGMIQLAIAETNLSYRNSDVKLVARLVDSYQVSYAESGNFGQEVSRFRGKTDGFMDEVHARRDQFGADLAVLIMDNPQYCGLASAILADEATGFAGVHYTCATGNFTFAHELGHLQGARHNPEQDGSTSPFAWGHGYFNESKHWRTVMSYNCPSGCTRIPYWSNPDINYNGDPTGTAAKHDNARVLDHTATIVGNFRGLPAGGMGYVWAHDPTSGNYAPSAT
jgi:peptidyl-Asp metalloendopeptidase